MADGACNAARNRDETAGLDPEGFARSLREFALEAHRVLRRPDSPRGDLIRLQGRVLRLLGEVPGTGSSGISQWLGAILARIGARLPSRSLDDAEPIMA